MDEIKQAIKNTVTENQAKPVLATISRRMKSWGLSLPDSPGLVFDFGIGEFETIGETEFWIANEIEHGYCGKYLFLFSNQRCPNHMHKIKHETFFIMKGSITLTLDEEDILMKQGETLSVSPGSYHTFIAHEETLILEISMPGILEDNYFTDPRLGYSLS